MTTEDAIDLLDKLDGSSPEDDHHRAEGILLEWLRAQGHPALAEAYERAEERTDWWYEA